MPDSLRLKVKIQESADGLEGMHTQLSELYSKGICNGYTKEYFTQQSIFSFSALNINKPKH